MGCCHLGFIQIAELEQGRGPGQGEGGPFLSASSEMLMGEHPAAPGEGKGVPDPLMDTLTTAV